MAATILNSPRAVEMSVYVVRAFVQLREMLASNKELARRFAQLETRLDKKLTAHVSSRTRRYRSADPLDLPLISRRSHRTGDRNEPHGEAQSINRFVRSMRHLWSE